MRTTMWTWEFLRSPLVLGAHHRSIFSAKEVKLNMANSFNAYVDFSMKLTVWSWLDLQGLPSFLNLGSAWCWEVNELLKHIPSFKSKKFLRFAFFWKRQVRGLPILNKSDSKIQEPNEGRQLLDIIKGVKAPTGDEGDNGALVFPGSRVGNDSDGIDTTWIDMLWLDHAFHDWKFRNSALQHAKTEWHMPEEVWRYSDRIC